VRDCSRTDARRLLEYEEVSIHFREGLLAHGVVGFGRGRAAQFVSIHFREGLLAHADHFVGYLSDTCLNSLS
jgi:hypothetical protein